MTLIGNKSKFAFDITDCNTNGIDKDKYRHISIWINNLKLIDSEEIVYLPSFQTSVSLILDRIINESNKFYNSMFENKTDIDIFNLLLDSKSYIDNLEDWNPETKNPIIGGFDDEEYFKHLILIDETIDQYQIFLIKEKDGFKFIWKCWDKDNCTDRELNEINSGKIEEDELIDILKNFIKNNAL